MFVPFAFTAGSRDGGSRVTVRRGGGRAARLRRRPATWWRCRSPTTATCRATVVFAGYGIVVPESQTFGYDSYAGLDVKDKVVLVLRYFPEDADQADARHPGPLLGPALQGDGGAAARRHAPSWSSPDRRRPTPAPPFR